MKRINQRKLALIVCLMFSVFLLISTPAFAKSSVIKAIPTGNNTSDGLVQPASIAPNPYVASLTIFADPTDDGTGSSGNGGILSFGKHAFITVKNTSSSNIQVGLLGGIAPGKTVSVGTWGNKTEHKVYGIT